jgi:3-deoxy-D-manno-octulosonic-acid transferase
VAPLLEWARRAGLRGTTLSEMEASAASEGGDVIVVDRVGVLGDLYALADAAFVGGGFHAAGLHSVIEPAAFGAPVLFGPQHDMSREAGLLLATGGAQVAHTSGSLHDVLLRWLSAPEARATAGRAARALVSRELGATERSVQLVEQLLRSHPRG